MNISIDKGGKLLGGIAAVIMVAAAITAMSCKASVTNANVSNAPATPSPVQKYKVTLEKTAGGNVTITPALPDDGMVNKDTNLTFTATALTGYELEKWECNGSAVNGQALSYTLTVNEAANVKVFFKTNGMPIITRTVTLTLPLHGTVTSVPEIPPDKQLPEGTEITFTAKADAGYVVDKWTVTPSEALKTGGTEGSETATVKVTADTTVTVTFKTEDKTYTVDGVSFTMKKIDAVMNENVGHSDENNNKPHKISLSAYLIGETEVTQELWQAVIGNNPSSFNGSPENGEVQGKRPVECVSWYQAIAFCNKLSKACSLEPCYTVTGINFDTLEFKNIPTSNDSNWNNAVCNWTKNGFRLPTEAEWEWAAKGGSDDPWARADDKDARADYAWYRHSGAGNANYMTHEVGKKKKNGYGLYDMSGNVKEWCWDWYDWNTPASGQIDPTGPASSLRRACRGGSYNNSSFAVACTNRNGGNAPDSSSIYIGFRLACRP